MAFIIYGKKLCDECGLYFKKLGTHQYFKHTLSGIELSYKSLHNRNKGGKNNGMWNGTHSKITRKNISISLMGNKRALGYLHTNEWKVLNGQRMKSLYRSGWKVPHTKYGFRTDLGHFVRSTWEANFARILNYLGIEYQYEPRRFDINGITTYTPDFYIPSLDLWIEIKGWDVNLSKLKRKAVRKLYGIKLFILKDTLYDKLKRMYHAKIQWEGV